MNFHKGLRSVISVTIGLFGLSVNADADSFEWDILADSGGSVAAPIDSAYESPHFEGVAADRIVVSPPEFDPETGLTLAWTDVSLHHPVMPYHVTDPDSDTFPTIPSDFSIVPAAPSGTPEPNRALLLLIGGGCYLLLRRPSRTAS